MKVNSNGGTALRFGSRSLGGPIGSGRQYISWIHRDDWLAMVRWALTNETVGGPLNAAAYIPVNLGAQYIQAGPGALTTAGRNTLRSNGYNRTDVTLIKNFRFGEERYNVQVGAEFFNLFNHPNPGFGLASAVGGAVALASGRRGTPRHSFVSSA